jgi:cytochrome P450
MRNMSRPFSLGPAMCVGKPLAEMNISLALARILQVVDVRLEGGVMRDDMMRTRDKGILHPWDEKLVVRVKRD